MLPCEAGQLSLTIANNGRMGYQDVYKVKGNGIQYNGRSLLYEGGLLLAQAIRNC